MLDAARGATAYEVKWSYEKRAWIMITTARLSGVA